MHTFVTLSLALGASALAVPRSSCSFELTAAGRTIGQLSDGQNRIGGGLSAATFTINNSGITDAAGRGCILTPSVQQFQCDQSVGPTYGFSIDSNGTLEYEGSDVFFACPASDTEWNLYTTPVAGQEKCVEISLAASGCGEAVAPSVRTVESVATVTVHNCALASSASEAPVVVATSAATVQSPVPVVASSSVSTPIVVSSPSAKTIPPVESTSVNVSSEVSIQTVETAQSQLSSRFKSSAPAVRPTTVVSAMQSSSVWVQTSVPVESTATAVPVEETTTLYSHSSVVPGNTESPSTLLTVVPTPTTLSSLLSANTTSTLPSTSSAATSSCIATTLTGSSTSGNYQYPHLILPISSLSPTTAAGTSYFGTISPNTSTIFNFDIPSSYIGATCNLIFLLPLQSQLQTSSYTYTGSSNTFSFEQLSTAATSATTWDNAPGVETELGSFVVQEGSSTLVKSWECAGGTTMAFEMKAVGDTYLEFFQDWNPSPLGLYVTSC